MACSRGLSLFLRVVFSLQINGLKFWFGSIFIRIQNPGLTLSYRYQGLHTLSFIKLGKLHFLCDVGIFCLFVWLVFSFFCIILYCTFLKIRKYMPSWELGWKLHNTKLNLLASCTSTYAIHWSSVSETKNRHSILHNH